MEQIRFTKKSESKEETTEENNSTSSVEGDASESSAADGNSSEITESETDEGTQTQDITEVSSEKDWEVQSWIATGEIAIDSPGLNIAGSVNAAFYKAGTEVPDEILQLPEIGSSNNIDEEEEPSAKSTEENTEEPSTRQSRRQARQQARQASREIEENTGTAETETDGAEEESSEVVTNSSETDTSTDETDPTDDSNDGAESDGIFDVDTIFTSGTFEIAADSNAGDAIFQGEVELAQMKITKEDDTWSPNSGKRPAPSELTSTVSISVAPLMLPTTERALKYLNPYSPFLRLAPPTTSMRKRNNQQNQQKRMLMHHRQDSRVDKQDNRLVRLHVK